MTPSEPASETSGLDASGWTEVRFRGMLGLATLMMLGLSWPLWVDQDEFPRVPFVGGLPVLPVGVSWLLFGLLVASVAAGIVWRGMLGVSLLPLAALIVQDQHRFQPWAYQYAMTALALATLGRGRALAFTRLLLIAVYFHSGLSKLDASFCAERGAQFLATASAPLGLEPWDWPTPARLGAILAMPVVELAVAVGLAIRRTRRWALAGAVALHAALLGILGSWGHSPIVLVWNVALIVEDLILFGSSPPAGAGRQEADSWLAPVTTVAFALAVVFPFGERWAIVDSWPSFALYASHAERTDVFVHEADLDAYPEPVRRHVSAGMGLSPWRWLDLKGWSLASRGVPVYPQGRACNGVAEALAARYRGAFSVRVIQWGRADLWTGRRSRTEVYGLDALRRLGDRYRLNAHPAGGRPGASGRG